MSSINCNYKGQQEEIVEEEVQDNRFRLRNNSEMMTARRISNHYQNNYNYNNDDGDNSNNRRNNIDNNIDNNCIVTELSSAFTFSSSSSISSSTYYSSFLFRKPRFILKLCLIFMLTIQLSSILFIQEVNGCNEAVCASIVSKCTLTQSCKCEMKNCTCCKECFDCLSYLYSECCSCVELCPKPNITNQVIMHSQVGDLKEPMPDLFNILTEETDLQGRWTTFTFPIDIDQSWFQPKAENPSMSTNVYTIADGKITIDPNKDIVTVNCTVAYMSQCMPLNKCKNSCHSMGASYFRWFHNGCCECVGTCINYGINESRCSECSVDTDEDDEDSEGEVVPPTNNEEASVPPASSTSSSIEDLTKNEAITSKPKQSSSTAVEDEKQQP